MAASPWKFLAGLARRGRKEEDFDPPDAAKPIETSGPSSAGEFNRIPERDIGTQPNAVDATTDINRVVEIPAATNEPEQPAGDPIWRSGSTVLTDASDQPGQTRSRTPSKRKRRAREAIKVDHASSTRTVVEASSATAAPLSASAQIQSLDDEIRELRYELARRLQAQNAQLRKMLERFHP